MSDQRQTPLGRRRLFAAGGTVGALAAAAAVLPLSKPVETPVQAKPAPEKGSGYQLTAHVQQYYDTARV